MIAGKDAFIELRNRLPYYEDDWKTGLRHGLRILAPSTYIFCCSCLPALAFGQQLQMETGGTFNVVHVLAATAISGVMQAVLGGQPLLIVGVAEPIVVIWSFLYQYASNTPALGPELYHPWTAWVCCWTALLVLLLGLSGACRAIKAFTRFSGEVFGALIAVLFLQVGIKGVVGEFQPVHITGAAAPAQPLEGTQLLVNGLWQLLLAAGLLLTSLKVVGARRWRFLRSWLRGFLADYGVPLLVVAWSGLSFALAGSGVAVRRVQTPNTWEVTQTWSVVGRMATVPGPFIAAALLPALIITVLFYFDHNVSSQMAQQPEFNLTKPAAYSYDFVLLALMTLICGLLGLPPVNGVLPQSPMHSRSLAKVKVKFKHRSKQANSGPASDGMSNGAADSIGLAAVSSTAGGAPDTLTAKGCGQIRSGFTASSIPSGLHPAAAAAAANPGSNVVAVGPQQYSGSIPAVPQYSSTTVLPPGGAQLPHCASSHVALLSLAQAAPEDDPQAVGVTGESPEGAKEGVVVPLQVAEQRVSGLLQSLLVAVCLAATPAIQAIPTGVLWGYFVFMALDSLPGSQLWERLLLLFTDPGRRGRVLLQQHAAYLQLVPFKVVARFTLLQLVYLVGVWALITWAGVAGVSFPVPIMALVPLRRHLLPCLFQPAHLSLLDAAEYEAAPPVDPSQLDMVAVEGAGAAPFQRQHSPAAPPEGGPLDSLSPADGAAGQAPGATARRRSGRSTEGAEGAPSGLELEGEFVGHQLVHHLTAEQMRRRAQAAQQHAATDQHVHSV